MRWNPSARLLPPMLRWMPWIASDPPKMALPLPNLESGYYLITSTNGNLAMVDTTPTNPDATVNEKNPDATLDKDVQEDSNPELGQ